MNSPLPQDTPLLNEAEKRKKYWKGGIIGALIGIPAPIIGPIIGGAIGVGYMWKKYNP